MPVPTPQGDDNDSDSDWRRFESAHYVQCPHVINGKPCGKLLGNVMKHHVVFVRAVVADQDRTVAGFMISKCPRCNHSLEWRVESSKAA